MPVPYSVDTTMTPSTPVTSTPKNTPVTTVDMPVVARSLCEIVSQLAEVTAAISSEIPTDTTRQISSVQ